MIGNGGRYRLLYGSYAMESKERDDQSDSRVASGRWRKTKAEVILEQIHAKQREIRLLEIERARTDPNELVPKLEGETAR